MRFGNPPMFSSRSAFGSRLRDATPTLLLLVALSTVFIFGNDRELLYRLGHHGGSSAQYLTVSKNLSPEHNFLLFWWESMEADGSRSYFPYNRFPIGGPALIKLATMPFSNSLTQQIYAARILMLVFFAGATVLAYISLVRLVGNRWISATATILGFSSCYCLYYNDFVCPEAVMDLCGVMLTFHGMVLFVQEGRFRQLLVKVSAALLVGWHVYALLLPFIVFGVAGELLRVSELRRSGTVLLSSPYLRLGVFSVFFGTLVLGFNFTNEYVAINATSVTELPSFQSMLKRFGMDETFNTTFAERLAWLPFLKAQFYRIGGMSLPYALSGYTPGPGVPPALPGILVGLGVSGACLVGLFRAFRYRLLLATLVLSGFCWALPMRHQSFTHDWLAMFYIGIPLVFFCMVLQQAHKLYGDRLVASLAVASFSVFVLSSFQMSRVGLGKAAATLQEEVIADFEVIRKLTEGQTVAVTRRPSREGFDGVPGSTMYYLSGRIIAGTDRADVLVTDERMEIGVGLLTPHNRRVFLYNRAVYDWISRSKD